MQSKSLFTLASCACLAALAGSLALAQPSKDTKSGQNAPKLPAGWTMEDMQACMIAGTPGKMHEHLASMAGTWSGTNKMWMAPDTEAMTSPTTWKVTPIMDGRYIRTEVTGDMGDMGPFNGSGICGYDNVTKQFVGDWIDNHSTGIMQGIGELSADGTTMSWRYNYNCPLTKKPTVMRQVQRQNGNSAISVEMFGTDPKTGKEFKCMQVELKKGS